MKILVISAHYPPFHLGGYEIRVKNIIDQLSCRGYEICVLTNKTLDKNKQDNQKQNYSVIRKLHTRHQAKFFPKEIQFDLLDTRLLEKQIQVFKPDVIYLGHTYPLSKALLPYLAAQNIPLVYDEGGLA